MWTDKFCGIRIQLAAFGPAAAIIKWQKEVKTPMRKQPEGAKLGVAYNWTMFCKWLKKLRDDEDTKEEATDGNIRRRRTRHCRDLWMPCLWHHLSMPKDSGLQQGRQPQRRGLPVAMHVQGRLPTLRTSLVDSQLRSNQKDINFPNSRTRFRTWKELNTGHPSQQAQKARRA